MAAVVSRERAKGTWLTGLAGLVILAVAFVMMAHLRPHGPTAQSASVSTFSLITRNGPASGAGRARQGGRVAGHAERGM